LWRARARRGIPAPRERNRIVIKGADMDKKDADVGKKDEDSEDEKSGF
jgi:hypothetical protein